MSNMMYRNAQNKFRMLHIMEITIAQGRRDKTFNVILLRFKKLILLTLYTPKQLIYHF